MPGLSYHYHWQGQHLGREQYLTMADGATTPQDMVIKILVYDEAYHLCGVICLFLVFLPAGQEPFTKQLMTGACFNFLT